MEKSDKLVLEVARRIARGKQNAAVRRSGLVPAVVYGRGVKSEPLEVEARVMERMYHQAGMGKIIALKVGEARARNVLIHAVQTGAARGELRHIDFYAVRMNEELRAEVPVHFVGESTAVYQREGTLMKNLDLVEVECLPADIPESFTVDIAVLDDFEKTITLADLVLPVVVKLVQDPETLVAKVEPPRSEAELAELDETVTEAAPETESGEAAQAAAEGEAESAEQ